MGPFRSGKSSGVVNEIYRQAKRQWPDAQGVRHSRWLISRTSQPKLKKTTIPTWEHWLPPPYSQITKSAPMMGSYRERLPDGTSINLEIMFVPLSDLQTASDELRGTDLTGAWINEGHECSKDVFDFVNGRIGSFPPTDLTANGKGNRQTSLLIDYNPPPVNHWLYEVFEEVRPIGFELFKQPPALLYDPMTGLFRPNPHAENIRNLRSGESKKIIIDPGHPLIESGEYDSGFGYYFGQLAGSDMDKIRVQVLNEYGSFYTGKKVFENYNDAAHASSEAILPVPHTLIAMGQDVGFSNATVFGQMIGDRLHIIDELYDDEMTIEQYVQDKLVITVRQNYPWMTAGNHLILADPASETRENVTGRRPFDLFQEAGLNVEPAYTNDVYARIDAVDHYLRKMVGGKPALVIGPRCIRLRQAFLGGYQWKGKGENRKPDKASEYSHIMDALQYLCLYYLKGVGDRRNRGVKGKARRGGQIDYPFA